MAEIRPHYYNSTPTLDYPYKDSEPPVPNDTDPVSQSTSLPIRDNASVQKSHHYEQALLTSSQSAASQSSKHEMSDHLTYAQMNPKSGEQHSAVSTRKNSESGASAELWKPSLDRKQSWSQQDQKRELQMGVLGVKEDKVEGHGFTEGSGGGQAGQIGQENK